MFRLFQLIRYFVKLKFYQSFVFFFFFITCCYIIIILEQTKVYFEKQKLYFHHNIENKPKKKTYHSALKFNILYIIPFQFL